MGAWVRGARVGGGEGLGGWERSEACVKIKKKIGGGGGGLVRGGIGLWGGGGQGVCEWRSEAFVKKKFFRGGGGGGGGGGCENSKKNWGGGMGVRVDVNGEVKLL